MAAIADNLQVVRTRIEAAARAAGRDPGTVTLLAVSKTHAAGRVRALGATAHHREMLATHQLDLGLLLG